MNYRDLLKKYMAHVNREEGTTFAPDRFDKEFTAEEVAEMKRIEDEVLRESS